MRPDKQMAGDISSGHQRRIELKSLPPRRIVPNPAPKPQTPPVQPAAFNCSLACKYIGISRSELYRLLNAGRIHSVRLGKCRLILRSTLDAFLQSLVDDADGEAS